MSTLSSSLTTYRVAAIQYEPALGEKAQNIRDLLALVEEAARHEARIIVLPEMATTGSCWISRDEIAPHTEALPGPSTELFQGVAAQYGCLIALPLPEVDPTTQVFYNSVVLLGPEGMIGSYRKLHSSIAEPRWARDGDLGVPVWDTPLGRIAAMIGTDARYFETARLAALHGADVLLLPANWSDERCPASCWLARAYENGLYVIAANRYGHERGIQFEGGSAILNPDGSIQSYSDTDQEIVYGEIDLAHARLKQWQHMGQVHGLPLADRRPEVYTPLVQNTYLWEPLRYHGLYDLGELPPGQLSCVGCLQMELASTTAASPTHETVIQALQAQLTTLIQDNAPACPDVLVLPELVLPGPYTATMGETTPESIRQHYQAGAISIPGPETDALVALVGQLQISLVLGVAERDNDIYYNTVLLLDPEGIYGTYRKLHLGPQDRLWASPGNLGLPTFDTPTGRIGLATGYDALFPETMRILASKGADLICVPALLAFPQPVGLAPSRVAHVLPISPDEYDPYHSLIWRVRAAEHQVYLALANWYDTQGERLGNGFSGIFSPTSMTYPWPEVVADEPEPGLLMMTIDTREQRTGRRTTHILEYSPGDMAGSLTGELAYNIRDSIPGNIVRSKPLLRKRQPFWYLDIVKRR